MAATGLLAKGWFRGRLGGWLGTAAVLAATLAMLVIVSAMFTGMQQETEQRVADVFTGELRVTPQERGVFSPGTFTDGEAAADRLGTAASPRLESQAVISKRSFRSILGTGDTPNIQSPGGEGDVSLGILVGADFTDPEVAPSYEKYLVQGRLPSGWEVPADWRTSDDALPRIPIAISLGTLDGFLTDEEKNALSRWPPTIAELDPLTFDLTAGVAVEGDFRNDIYRNPARVVGIYETDVETLDSFTAWGPIEAARFLLGHEPHGTKANVLIVHGDAAQAQGVADDEDWATEGAGDFTERYLGQLILALRTLSIMTASVLFTIPAFLVAHGVERVLEAQRREVAVLRAMGVPARSVRRAMARLVVLTVAIAVAVAAALAVGLTLLLKEALPRWDGAPVPLDVVVTWQSVAAGVGVAAVSCLVAFFIAMRSQGREDLPTMLRAA